MAIECDGNGQVAVGTLIDEINASVKKAGDIMTGNLEVPSLSIGGNNVSTVETVTNSNGTYVKISDGTLICYNQLDTFNFFVTVDGFFGTTAGDIEKWNKDVTYPLAFIDIPVICLSSAHWNTASTYTTDVSTSTFKARVCLSPDADETLITVDYIAIGRWK